MKKMFSFIIVFALVFSLKNVSTATAEDLIQSNTDTVEALETIETNLNRVIEDTKEVSITEDVKKENNEEPQVEVASINFQIEGQTEGVNRINYEDEEEIEIDEIADPLFYLNYVFFHFNDKLQTWVLEPTSKGYKKVTPDIARIGISNFFVNLTAPINVVNNLLQLNFTRSGKELLRFVINTTVGVAGFYDASTNLFDIQKHSASLGQTLGYYGIGHGIYIVWPIIGPSSIRETIGFAGDSVLSYSSYVPINVAGSAMVVDKVNDTSFKLGNYDFIVGNGLDPYSAMKDAFTQYNVKKVKNVGN
ncbi:MAG: MlaA family lipoprotein [Candidatus Gracilibacteria bacterium]|nr:MlaA family lipoprotein [Candidatus Gracilibacteria bacterium]MDD2908975.1 MlaA family lipoprotein [Candidatus Gracilibacteria bacterium]